jgi:choline dehydrogenase-like flavoprotein
VDLLGDPRVVLDWSLNALDEHTLREGACLVIEELRSHQLIEGRPYEDLRVRQPGDHHMGTTRMSTSPATGYVDANCRVHHLDNLFVASSSVFSTGGYANPTLTIIALAVRLAAHLTGRTTELAEPVLEEAAGT